MPTKQLARIENTYSWTNEQIELIRDMCAKGCTDDEFKVLLYVADKYKLDPLTKQIYSQKYNDKPAAIIITYAGMQEIANRDNLLDGLYCEAVRDGEGRVTGARSTIWKKGCNHPFVVEVELDEYIQYAKDRNGKPYVSGLWATKPVTMIKKVANAQNMRQAFSLGQMYVEEEMPVAEAVPADEEDQPTPAPGLIQPKQTVVITPALPPDKVERIGLGHAIDMDLNVKTVDNRGEWLDITASDLYSASFRLIAAKTFKEINEIVGGDVKTIVERTYQDATTPQQKMAATVHYLYGWAKEQDRHSQEAANAKERMAKDAAKTPAIA